MKCPNCARMKKTCPACAKGGAKKPMPPFKPVKPKAAGRGR